VKNSVVISTGYGRLHLYHAALAAQQGDVLNSLLTSFYLGQRWVPTIEGIAKLSRSAFWRRIRFRRDNQLDDSRVVSLASTEAVSRLLKFFHNQSKSETVGYWLERMESLYYGKRANRHIRPPARLVHSRSGFSRAVIPHAHAIGAKVLLEQSSAHPRFTWEILESEYEKWGVPREKRNYIRPLREMEWDIAHADCVLTNSEFCASTIRPFVDQTQEVYVVHTGVNTEKFQPAPPRAQGKFKILYVGSLSTFKGVVYLIKAFEKLRLPEAELVLLGSPYFDRPVEVDRLSGLYTRLSYVPDIAPVFADANVFVSPALAEGSSLVVGEAMASGLACIVTPNTGSVIRDGVDGFIVPPRQIDALAEKILCLYEKRDLAIAMGRAARQRALEVLTWNHYGQQVLRVYEQIIAGCQHSARQDDEA
jgi:glycosyltransferase involved in cell wall biosynthesis